MKLLKKEAGMIRLVAFNKNVLHDTESVTAKRLESTLALIPVEKQSLAIGYFDYLTSTKGKKVFNVDFTCNGAGTLTFYDCTAEEAKEQALYDLQNGAFGKFEKLEDITITNVTPDTIHYNSFSAYKKSRKLDSIEEMKKLA